jgi:hypothetical protein
MTACMRLSSPAIVLHSETICLVSLMTMFHIYRYEDIMLVNDKLETIRKVVAHFKAEISGHHNVIKLSPMMYHVSCVYQ